jgi:hypothetical protein
MQNYVDGPDGLFYLGVDANGYYAYAFGQHVAIDGSPVVIRFDPPIAPTVDAGEIYRTIQAQLSGGQ